MLMTEPYPVVPVVRFADVALQDAITTCTARGWRLQTISGTTAVMVSGGGQVRTYWGLHLFLTLATCGAYGLIWAVIAVAGSRADHTERSLLITVNARGEVDYQRGR